MDNPSNRSRLNQENIAIMANQHHHAAEVYPKRVIWMQEEETLKWVLVGLSDEGEVQDPQDFEDVRVPMPDQPSGRVWVRDETTGKWGNLLVEASKEELARAQTAIRRRAEAPKQQRTRQGPPQQRSPGGGNLSSIHQNYAMRLSGTMDPYQDAICEEEIYSYQEKSKASVIHEVEEVDGVKYHIVKPSDTFNFICLKYKVSADALRGANNFTGSTLQYAPNRLVIPPPTQKKKVVETPVVNNNKISSSTPENRAVSDSSPTGIISINRVTSSSRDIYEKNEEAVQYHWVEPDDSLRWICLKYKVNANDLRHANNFTGSNLKLAPKKLVIPKSSLTRSSSKKGPRGPRTRRLRSNGSGYSSMRSVDSFASSFLTMDSSMLTRGDEDSVVGGCSVAGSLASFGANGQMPLTAILSGTISCDVASVEQGGVGATAHLPSENNLNSSYPDNLNLNINNSSSHQDNLNASYHNLGSHGSELAPVSMVHVAGARKLYDQMSCDSDSMDDEEGTKTPANIIGGSDSKQSKTRYHDVRPTDTVEYLCLKYRVSASALRRANIGLTGRNLQTGPKRLIIPPNVPSNTSTLPIIANYRNKETQETVETETVTTHDDDTNTIALSDGHSTLADQLQSLDMTEEAEEDDTIYHDIQPSDTLQGLCLQYGVSAYELRRANNFRGMNLRSAPDRLVIPKNERNQPRKGLDFKTMTEDEKIQALLAHLPISRQSQKPLLSYDEARAYLEFNEWSFERALRNANVDAEWSSRKSGR